MIVRLQIIQTKPKSLLDYYVYRFFMNYFPQLYAIKSMWLMLTIIIHILKITFIFANPYGKKFCYCARKHSTHIVVKTCLYI